MGKIILLLLLLGLFIFSAYAPTEIKCPPGSQIKLDGCDVCVSPDPLVISSAHATWVRALAFSPDSSIIVSAGMDKYLNIWNAKTGAVIRKLTGHTLELKAVAYSPDGTYIATGSGDKSIILWNAATGVVVNTFTGHTDVVRSVIFTKDSKTILSSSNDKTIKIWSITTKSLIKTLSGHSNYVTSIDISPDEKLIISGCFDKTMNLWDFTSGSILKSYTTDHLDYILSVKFKKADPSILLSAAYDKTAKIWKTNSVTYNIESSITLTGHTLDETKAVFSPNSQMVATCNEDFDVKLWDATSGELLGTFKGHTKALNYVEFSPDGKLIGSGGGDSSIRIWDIYTLSCSKCDSTNRGFIQTPTSSICTCPSKYFIVKSNGMASCILCTITNCDTCEQTLANQAVFRCLACISGYSLSDDKLTCSLCSSTQYLQTTPVSKCVECSSITTGCATCTSSGCNSCIAGYLLSSGICKVCDELEQGCSSCEMTSSVLKCLGCKTLENYALTSSNLCSCISGYFKNTVLKKCESCALLQNCLNCFENNLQLGSPVCSQCVTGFYINTSGSCSDCSVLLFCINCSDQNTCTTCNPSIDNLTMKSGKCTCIEGSFYNSLTKKCEICPAPCSKCSEDATQQGSSECSECSAVVPSVLLGKICMDCSLEYACKNCEAKLNSLSCIQCADTFIVMDGKCACPQGFYKKIGQMLCEICSSAIPYCKECYFGTDNLLKCGKCLDDDNYFILPSTKYCTKCSLMKGCKTCEENPSTDSGNCLSCVDTFITVPTGGLCKCPDSYYLKEPEIVCELCSTKLENCVNCVLSSNILNCVSCPNLFTINANKCIPCPNNCEICSFTTAIECLQCFPNYYLKSTQCYSCDSLQGCDNSCSSSGKCTKCLSTFLLSNEGVCQCPIGYYADLTATKSCLSCKTIDTYCATCDSSACQTCASSYYLDNLKKCLSCSTAIEGCLSCDSNEFCLNCDSTRGFQLSNDNKQCTCQSLSYYNSAIQRCQLCEDKIKFCEKCHESNAGEVTCESCIQSCPNCKSMFILEAGICVCNKGWYMSENNICISCLEAIKFCLECSLQQTKQLQCQLCSPGYFLFTSYCTSVCPDGFWGDPADGSCKPCSPDCKTCSSEGASICKSCSSPKFLLNSKCVLSCGPGYLGDEVERRCKLCDSTCASCSISSIFCTSCLLPLFLEFAFANQGKCVQECGTNFFKNYTSHSCDACHKSCNTCQGPLESNCLTCPSKYYLTREQICLGCNTECNECKKSADNCISCSEEYKLIEVNSTFSRCTKFSCNEFCARCIGPNLCDSCLSDYYYLYNTSNVERECKAKKVISWTLTGINNPRLFGLEFTEVWSTLLLEFNKKVSLSIEGIDQNAYDCSLLNDDRNEKRFFINCSYSFNTSSKSNLAVKIKDNPSNLENSLFYLAKDYQEISLANYTVCKSGTAWKESSQSCFSPKTINPYIRLSNNPQMLTFGFDSPVPEELDAQIFSYTVIEIPSINSTLYSANITKKQNLRDFSYEILLNYQAQISGNPPLYVVLNLSQELKSNESLKFTTDSVNIGVMDFYDLSTESLRAVENSGKIFGSSASASDQAFYLSNVVETGSSFYLKTMVVNQIIHLMRFVRINYPPNVLELFKSKLAKSSIFPEFNIEEEMDDGLMGGAYYQYDLSIYVLNNCGAFLITFYLLLLIGGILKLSENLLVKIIRNWPTILKIYAALNEFFVWNFAISFLIGKYQSVTFLLGVAFRFPSCETVKGSVNLSFAIINSIFMISVPALTILIISKIRKTGKIISATIPPPKDSSIQRRSFDGTYNEIAKKNGLEESPFRSKIQSPGVIGSSQVNASLSPSSFYPISPSLKINQEAATNYEQEMKKEVFEADENENNLISRRRDPSISVTRANKDNYDNSNQAIEKEVKQHEEVNDSTKINPSSYSIFLKHEEPKEKNIKLVSIRVENLEQDFDADSRKKPDYLLERKNENGVLEPSNQIINPRKVSEEDSDLKSQVLTPKNVKQETFRHEESIFIQKYRYIDDQGLELNSVKRGPPMKKRIFKKILNYFKKETPSSNRENLGEVEKKKGTVEISISHEKMQKNFQVLEKDFRKEHFLTHCFFAFDTIRQLFVTIVLLSLENNPLEQTILITLTSFVTIGVLLWNRPYSKVKSFIQSIVVEILFSMAMFGFLTLAILDNKGNRDLDIRMALGWLISYTNMALIFLMFGSIAIRIISILFDLLSKLKMKYGDLKKNKIARGS